LDLIAGHYWGKKHKLLDFAVNQEQPVRMRRMLSILACLTILLGTYEYTYAGSGTPSDPWRSIWPEENFNWHSTITSIYQEITPTHARIGTGWKIQYWSFNPNYSMPGGAGFYMGLQEQGLLWHNHDPLQTYTVDETARFSLFSNRDINSFKMLDTTNCVTGADSSDPSTGISCGIQYSWIVGVRYRLWANVYEHVSGSWCPASSYLDCTVYQGMVAPASNLSAATQIAVFSVNPTSYGHIGTAESFLEYLGVVHTPNCTQQNSVSGGFVVAFEMNGTTPYPVASVTGGDNFVTVETRSGVRQTIPICAWMYNGAYYTTNVSY
jgi:hypothetical protein